MHGASRSEAMPAPSCLPVLLCADEDSSPSCFRVVLSLVQVEELKQVLIKKLGPPSLTGFSTKNILMYERGVQPGLPLEVGRHSVFRFFPGKASGRTLDRLACCS